MKKSIVLTFTAACLLMAAAVALVIYGQDIFEGQRWAAAEGVPKFSMTECYYPPLKPWERASLACGFLSFSVTVAGAMLWDAETRPQPPRVSVLGLDTGGSGIVVRPAPPAAFWARAGEPRGLTRRHAGEGLTPLERVIRGY
jgi:hypothetical protein